MLHLQSGNIYLTYQLQSYSALSSSSIVHSYMIRRERDGVRRFRRYTKFTFGFNGQTERQFGSAGFDRARSRCPSTSRTMLANMTVDRFDPRSMEVISPVSFGLLGLALAWSMSKMIEGQNSGRFFVEGSDGEWKEVVRWN